MKFARFLNDSRRGLAVATFGHEFTGLLDSDLGYADGLQVALTKGEAAVAALVTQLQKGKAIDIAAVTLLPPLDAPPKIICIGLNYVDHSAEAGFKPPTYPTIFSRFTSSLIGHRAPIVRPRVSTSLDYEGELVVVIGRGGRSISKASALNHVFGYSIFNDASIRDYQVRTPQWTIGKNFDGTGAFGPHITTAEELPLGAKGLELTTSLNGEVVQKGNTNDLIFDVATLISTLSEAMTLSPGDIIVSGTPAGVGMARKPPLWMKAGDTCEVRIEGIGALTNSVADQDTNTQGT